MTRRFLPQSGPKRQLAIHGLLALAGFALAWSLAAFVFFPDDGPVDVVLVPAVHGLQFEDAQKQLADAGLEAAMGESRLSSSMPRGAVLGQTPAAGTRVTRGITITLDVSAGQRSAPVPRLTGMSRAAAEAALRELGLAVGSVVERAGREARGTVLETQPEAGRVVPEGTPVQLVLSAGPSELTLPAVVGRELVQARAILEQLGLTVRSVEFDSTSVVPRGVVVAQYPAAGSIVKPGSEVALRVSGRP